MLKYFGLDPVDFPASQVGDGVAILDDNLETFLKVTWPEWQTSCTAIEKAADILPSKNALAYRSATLEAAGEIPSMLCEVLAKVTC